MMAFVSFTGMLSTFLILLTISTQLGAYITHNSDYLANLSMPSYRECRRLTSPIYVALMQELLEDGCFTTAKHFNALVIKEQQLFHGALISRRAFTKPEFLLGLYDNCKMAEKSGKQKNGQLLCSRLLLQCILICERFRKEFYWVLCEISRIMAGICEHLMAYPNGSEETLCQIFQRCAQIAAKDTSEAMKYLKLAFKLAEGASWTTLVGTRGKDQVLKLTSAVIAESLIEITLKLARNLVHEQPDQAAELAEAALVILSNGNWNENRLLFINVYLEFASFLIKGGKYRQATSTINHISKSMRSCSPNDKNYVEVLSRYTCLKGQCYSRTDQKYLALMSHYESLRLSTENDMKNLQIEALLDAADVYIALGVSQSRMAEKCLQQVKFLSKQVGDASSLKKAIYLFAKVKILQVYPLLLDVIRNSRNLSCDLIRLRGWKDSCAPFWINLNFSYEKEQLDDPLDCLRKSKT
ncbi:uncharacterized protein ACN2A1_003890 isoform 1-T4 [Glossina fuscipes fuscipes]